MAKKKKEVTPADIESAEVDVEESAKELADSKEMLEHAQERHAAAVAAHAELTADPPPVYGKHLCIEGLSGRIDMPAEWGGFYQFRLFYNGQYYDHVSETPAIRVDDDVLPGVWVYRKH